VIHDAMTDLFDNDPRIAAFFTEQAARFNPTTTP
jgi:hypothetical protein